MWPIVREIFIQSSLCSAAVNPSFDMWSSNVCFTPNITALPNPSFQCLFETAPTSAPMSRSVSVVGSCRFLKKRRMCFELLFIRFLWIVLLFPLPLSLYRSIRRKVSWMRSISQILNIFVILCGVYSFFLPLPLSVLGCGRYCLDGSTFILKSVLCQMATMYPPSASCSCSDSSVAPKYR